VNALTQELLAARRLPPPAVAKAIRRGAGCSQAQLAKALGVTRVTCARYEAGTRSPRGDLRLRYIALLDELREVPFVVTKYPDKA
jgi:DNA-binding XRE family transcriptional regulator